MTKPREMTQEELAEGLEHRDTLLNLRAILATSHGMQFFKYLFKHLEVGELPDVGMEGNLLFEKLGFLRAGNSIWKLAAEANVQAAANLIAANEKERYDKLVKQYQDENG